MIAVFGLALMVCGVILALHVKPSSPLAHRMGSAFLAGTGALLVSAYVARPDLMPLAMVSLGICVLWVALALPALEKG